MDLEGPGPHVLLELTMKGIHKIKLVGLDPLSPDPGGQGASKGGPGGALGPQPCILAKTL